MKIGDCTSIAIGGTQVSKAYVGSTLVWPTSPTPPQRDYSKEYLTFEIVSGGTLEFGYYTYEGTAFTRTVYYSLDNGETWTSWDNTPPSAVAGYSVSISVQAGDIVLVKGNNSTYGAQYKSTLFGGTAFFNLYGNIMSLIYGDNFDGQTALTSDYTFRNMFASSVNWLKSNVISARNLVLPSESLTRECYRGLFLRCASLVNAPELPAYTLARECYAQMFYGCTSLVNAPSLPSQRMEYLCYNSMFEGCTSLVNAPRLPSWILNQECYEAMFKDCTSLVNAPELNSTNLVIGCYSSMFAGCTSLVTAPELPATTLLGYCYSNMFAGCTSLVTAPELPATTLANHCYETMFYGCTSLETAPELPATALTSYCYNAMFKGCTNLNYIKCIATTFASYSTNNWVEGVSATGTFVKDPTATWPTTEYDGVPSGWTVVNNE